MGLAQRTLALAAVLLVSLGAFAQGLDTARISDVMGRPGQALGDVYKLGFPRTDLRVFVGGVAIRPGLALGSWAAFAGTDAAATVMGDLVLLQSEVNPVMAKLRAADFDITALHNHLLGETPRLMYMHYMGHGPAIELARSLRTALAASRTPLGPPAPRPARAPAPSAWARAVEAAMGRKGAFSGEVLSFGLPRASAVTMGGMVVAASQGVAESINFQAAGPGKVATTGDFVLTAEEVNPVISALEAHHIQVTALHSHMLTEQPRLFFMHFWAMGSPAELGNGMRAALSHVAIQ